MTLPIAQIEADFHAHIDSSPLVISASTGSGKSTCLPVWAKKIGRVLVVQPRRIACTSLAEYLAEQSQQPLGKEIGYAIRFESYFDENTQVVFVTPGVALRWFFESKLKEFDVVMLDEFHERRWDMDLLLALLKSHQAHKLIVTSATLDTQPLCDYLNATHLHSDGKMFPVEETFIADDMRAMPNKHDLAPRVYQACTQALNETQGDILVFLPGKGEIQSAASALKELDAIVIGLYSGCHKSQQDLALKQQSKQRIILATNVAETSLTIPNITCVIDSGLERRTHLRGGKTVLALEAIAADSAKQRLGRAGRTQVGNCIRLYGQYAPLIKTTPPEINREALSELVLASACAGFNIHALQFLEPLPSSSLNTAITQLQKVDALDGDLNATELGKVLYPLPIDAEYAYLITQMPSGVLKQAMIDAIAVLSVPARVYQLPNNSEQLEELNKTLPNHCDLELAINLLRGRAPHVNVEQNAFEEAKQFSEQLREAFSLPELSKAANFDRNLLLQHIAQARPDLLYIKRNNRRGAFGNGHSEVIPAKDSRINDKAQAMIVLDTYAMAGKGTKQAMTLATCAAPVPLSLISEFAQCETTLNNAAIIDDDIMVNISLIFAGVELSSKLEPVTSETLIPACVELILNNQLMPGVAEQVIEMIDFHTLYNLSENITEALPTAEQYLKETLTDLGIREQDDLALIEPEDLFYQGVESWLIEPFKEKYPLKVVLPELKLSVEYFFKAKRLTLHYESGARKDAPKRWELPAWQGFKIQYKKASKVVDVK